MNLNKSLVFNPCCNVPPPSPVRTFFKLYFFNTSPRISPSQLPNKRVLSKSYHNKLEYIPLYLFDINFNVLDLEAIVH